jgi:hypothetical protein
VKSQKFRLQKLEEQLQQNKAQQPLFIETPDGHVGARVLHHKNGTSAMVSYDSLSLAQEDAIQALWPRLPTGSVLFVVPRMLTPEEWTVRYSHTLEGE